jgi:hypothetical protein
MPSGIAREHDPQLRAARIGQRDHAAWTTGETNRGLEIGMTRRIENSVDSGDAHR